MVWGSWEMDKRNTHDRASEAQWGTNATDVESDNLSRTQGWSLVE